MKNYETGSLEKQLNNTQITIHYKHIELKTIDILSYLNPKEFNAYCKNGCPNHSQKWTCPPNCPSFENYAKDYSKISLYLFYTSPNQLKKVENKALSAYNFIKEELQSYLRQIEPSDGKMIAANSCEICKTCGLVSGKECHIPEKMRYNLVAFGFNVSQIMTDLFQHELKWATKDQIPDFVSSVGAILKK
jgi:predicted metal-binding protein